MLTVTLMKGLPGSGKSVWAKDLVRNYPDQYKRVSKNDLRMMLDAGKYSSENEEFILNLRDQIILLALQSGKNVIVDDTNLDPIHEAHIRDLIKGKARLIIEDFTNTSIETCISNDLRRLNSVGERVILALYEKWIAPKENICNLYTEW